MLEFKYHSLTQVNQQTALFHVVALDAHHPSPLVNVGELRPLVAQPSRLHSPSVLEGFCSFGT